ncbi:MAG TPA: hypothetical protein VM100_10955 [Longimicrobiales bacterium]|nr:hypothetical protein [Longimicrobiales bacterium]
MKKSLIIAALSACTACASTLTPDETPYVGIIVSSNNMTVHVKPTSDQVCGTVFTIKSNTAISVRSSTGAVTRADAGILVVGAKVNAWAKDGVVFTSCPGQATAEAIQVVQ